MRITLKIENIAEIGRRAISIITERTAMGYDQHGIPFAAYSTKPFLIPAGVPTRATLRRLGKKGYSYVNDENGILQILILRGYEAYKKAWFPQDGGKVNLWASGSMMRSMAIIQVTDKSVTIGFTRPEEGQKAYYHQVAGVGSKNTKRQFLGLNAAEIAELSNNLSVTIQVQD